MKTKTLFAFIPLFLIVVSLGCIGGSAVTDTDTNVNVNVDTGDGDSTPADTGTITTGTQYAKTPQEAFNGYRKSITDKNYADFKKYAASATVSNMEEADVTQEQFSQAAQMLIDLSPAVNDVEITQDTTGDVAAVWFVNDKNDPSNSGKILFKKESDGWKVFKEEWVSNA